MSELLAFAPVALLVGVLLFERSKRAHAIRSLDALQKGRGVHGKAVNENHGTE